MATPRRRTKKKASFDHSPDSLPLRSSGRQVLLVCSFTAAVSGVHSIITVGLEKLEMKRQNCGPQGTCRLAERLDPGAITV